MTAVLTIWTVYRSPRDHPGQWVLRGFDVGYEGGPRPQANYVVADSLGEVRAALPPGLTRLARSDEDDPVVYESWV